VSAKHAVIGTLLCAGGVFGLNGVLLLYSWLPEYRFERIGTSSASFLIGMAVYTGLFLLLPGFRRRLTYAVTGLFSVLLLFSLGETFTQFIYGQPFVPWTDLRFVPALFDMILGIQTGAAVVIPIVLVALAVFWFPLLLLFRLVERGAERAGMLALVPIAILFLLSIPLGFDRSLALMAAKNLRRPAEELAMLESTGNLTPAARPISSRTGGADGPATDHAFGLLEDRDLYLIIVESYGRTLLTNDSHRSLIEPFFDQSESFLQSRGYYVYSNFLDSPTTGGRSWLADSTLWTGVRIDSESLYQEMTGSRVKNLMSYVEDAGYYRYLTAPGTSYSSEEWRAYYDFDEYYFRHDFGYRGPLFTLGAMPDQFVLRQVRDLVADHKEENETPVFVTAILVSSHVPFEQIPQYVDDWDGLGNGDIFNTLPMVRFDNNWLSGGEYPEGYTAGIKYSLGATFEFIDRFVEDDGLVIVVGDHQPRLPVRERDAGSSVFVHAISKNRKLVKAFEVYGYERGLVPQQKPPHKGMEEFLPELMSVITGIAATAFVP
jgi:hypothetical protein